MNNAFITQGIVKNEKHFMNFFKSSQHSLMKLVTLEQLESN